MNKLRSDSAFCQLTPQQVEALDGWLFEERLSYPKVVEKLKAEFGLETSLTAVRRFYKRLEMERSRESLMDAVEMSGLTVEALKSGDLKPAMLLLANKCLFELMMKSDPPIRKVTALLRAITSAEGRAFRQTLDDREQALSRERERLRKVEEERRRAHWQIKWEDEEEQRQKRAARKKAKLEAAEKEKAGSEVSLPCRKPDAAVNLATPHPGPLLVEGRGDGSVSAVHGVIVRGSTSGHSISRNGKGAPASLSAVALTKADGTAPSDAAWQPTVFDEREYAEGYAAEAAENRLTPLNAA